MARTRQQTRASQPTQDKAKDSPSSNKKASRSTSKPKEPQLEPASNTTTNNHKDQTHPTQQEEKDDDDDDDQTPQNDTVLHFTVPHTNNSEIPSNIRPAKPSPSPPTSQPKQSTKTNTMIFTHGASGTLSTPSTSNFAAGFAAECTDQHSIITDPVGTGVSSIACFQGPMNLKARTGMFLSVARYLATESEALGFDSEIHSPVFGGTSMGARAAVMAANQLTTRGNHDRSSSSTESGPESEIPVHKLILASYPLESPKGELRDKILLEIDSRIEVLFIIGTHDSMCDLGKLDEVRRRMKAKSWLLVVEGAKHGMECREKKRTKEMQMATGRVAAAWARNHYRAIEGDIGGMEGYPMNHCLPIERVGNSDGNGVKGSDTGDDARKRQRLKDEEDSKTKSDKKRKRKKTG